MFVFMWVNFRSVSLRTRLCVGGFDLNIHEVAAGSIVIGGDYAGLGAPDSAERDHALEEDG